MSKVRYGKTRREKESGVHGNRFSNREKRVAWQQSRNAYGSHSFPFPREACNGKRNRFRVTGKNGKSIVLGA